MAVTLDDFIESLAGSGLMDGEEIRTFVAGLPPDQEPRDAAALAQQLVCRKRLTKFQARAVYQRKTRGLVVGNYVVLEKIGEGGMGYVFKAEHRRMRRVVALKMLPSMVSRSQAKRFQREVEAAARLTHPNIVIAYDADKTRGVHYLVMEYVDGCNLAQLVHKHGPVSVSVAVDYICQAAEALEYAHHRRVIHRDVKPENLVLDKQGTVKILDMGLARIEHRAGPDETTCAESLTKDGLILGTVDYMSPEQATDAKLVDRRADIYSLGCTLFYLLTGRSVYGGDDLVQKIMAHREKPIPSLRTLRNDVPKALDRAFQRMVAKRVEDRHDSMLEVIAELRASLTAGAREQPSTIAERPESPAGAQVEAQAAAAAETSFEPMDTFVSQWLEAELPETGDSLLHSIRRRRLGRRLRMLIWTAVAAVAALFLYILISSLISMP